MLPLRSEALFPWGNHSEAEHHPRQRSAHHKRGDAQQGSPETWITGLKHQVSTGLFRST